jgi:hypothetical protein
MRLSDKQAHQLVALLQSSTEKNVVGFLCFDFETRISMLNEIINQQDTEVKEINPKV